MTVTSLTREMGRGKSRSHRQYRRAVRRCDVWASMPTARAAIHKLCEAGEARWWWAE